MATSERVTETGASLAGAQTMVRMGTNDGRATTTVEGSMQEGKLADSALREMFRRRD